MYIREFKGLSKKFNCAVKHVTNKCLPMGFDVSDNAPSTFEELKEHYNKTGRICVFNGASENTIYGDKEINYCFRAWHDYHHLKGNNDFTKQGEINVAFSQMTDIVDLYGYSKDTVNFLNLLFADTVGQVEYFDKYNKFPENQLEFVEYYMENNNVNKEF